MTEMIRPGGGSPFDAIKRTDEHGDHWSARDLMPLLGYGADWRNFDAAISRAKITASNTGQDATSLFGAVTENSGGRPRSDYRLTRYAAYLVAMNGDPRKPEIAKAQEYFAVRTRQAEVAEQAPRFVIPQTMADALRLAADEHDRANAAEQKVAELAPAAETWQALANAAGDLSLRDAAQILSRDPGIEIGQNRLAKLLRQLGWIDKKTKRPYQHQVDTGRLSAIVSHWTDEDGELHTKYLARVTAKGLEALRGHLNGSKPLPIRFPADDVWGEAS